MSAVIWSAARNTSGEVLGPWAKSIVDIHGRSAAQSLMNVISSFKRCAFQWEDEWRLVCRPRHAAAGSAPDLDDEAFRHLIKKDGAGRRHIDLSMPEQVGVFCGFPSSAIPFSAVYVSDDARACDSERQRIREILRECGRSDITVR